MSSLHVRPALGLRGVVRPSGDKSIAHRALILGAIADHPTRLSNFPINRDCLATLAAIRKLGIRIKLDPSTRTVTVFGKGLHGLAKPRGPLFAGESGTTFRLLMGLAAGQHFKTKLSAAASLTKRPMARLTKPLRLMGAVIRSSVSARDEYPPIAIEGGSLRGITYRMPVASAQVKSALLLAGLYACGVTRIVEPVRTRDHTERMLKVFRAPVTLGSHSVTVRMARQLVSPGRMYIPGDISSAAFFIVAALLLPCSRLRVKSVGLNPSRLGAITVLRRMGGRITVVRKPGTGDNRTEPSGDLVIKASRLRGTVVKSSEIPSLIDEIPILMVAACFARGRTVVRGIQELRVKETDRIRSMSENLRSMGGRVSVLRTKHSEDIIIEGPCPLYGSSLRSFGDHRTAMSLVIAGLAARGSSSLDDTGCIKKSFPDFLSLLKILVR